MKGDKWTCKEGIYRIERSSDFGEGLTKGRALLNMRNKLKYAEAQDNKRKGREERAAHDAIVDAKLAAVEEMDYKK